MNERASAALINKATQLMGRVIRLNEAAGGEAYFNLEFAGNVNAVIFAKNQKEDSGEYTNIYRMTAYLDVQFGCTLDDIEEQIIKEELEDGTVSV